MKIKKERRKTEFFSSRLKENYNKKTEKFTKSKKNDRKQNFFKRHIYGNIYRYNWNLIYWVPLPNNLSYPSGERKIPVCLFQNSLKKVIIYCSNIYACFDPLFGHPYWHSFWIIIWDYFRSDKAVFGWKRFPFLE